PHRDGLDKSRDQLATAALALGRADLPAEVLRDDDVGGLLGPGAGNLDIALFEYRLAALVADHGGPDLPFDLVERIDAGFGEEARERETGRGRGHLRFGARLVPIHDHIGSGRRARGHTRLGALLASARGLVGVLHGRSLAVYRLVRRTNMSRG